MLVPLGQVACVGLVFLGAFTGSRRRVGWLAVLVGWFAVTLALVHADRERSNLFAILQIQPEFRSSANAARVLKKMERLGLLSNEQLATFRHILLDANRRASYLLFGNRGALGLKNATDSAEFAVRVLGPTLLWYPLAIMTIFAAAYSFDVRAAASKGLLLLLCHALLELVVKSDAGDGQWFLNMSYAPFNRPFDNFELVRCGVAFAYSLVLYFYAYFPFEARRETVLSLERMLERNEAIFGVPAAQVSDVVLEPSPLAVVPEPSPLAVVPEPAPPAVVPEQPRHKQRSQGNKSKNKQ